MSHCSRPATFLARILTCIPNELRRSLTSYGKTRRSRALQPSTTRDYVPKPINRDRKHITLPHKRSYYFSGSCLTRNSYPVVAIKYIQAC
jgi:hypothetical protein